MKFFICLNIFIVISLYSFAQPAVTHGACRVSGKVLDSASGQSVAYATVTAFFNDSSRVAGGAITDEKGAFTIEDLMPGTYNIKVDFISYNAGVKNNIVVTTQKPVAALGNITIAGNSKTIKEVTITGSRNFMENHLDKLVYNVEKDITSQGGVATDVLKKVPQVSVDVDGNIELLGSSNVQVFINGKPSTMFDNNLAEALQTIPASQIKSIEVISSPGAQYDAQGTGGIINIILKDNKSQGVSGNVALSGGTRLENGSANVHVHKGSLDISASLSGNAQLKGTTPTSLNRTTDSVQLIQNGNGTLQKNNYRAQVGMDWQISKKDDITASIGYSSLETINDGAISQQQIAFYPAYSDAYTVRNAQNTLIYNTLDWNVNYKKKFHKEGQELNLSYQSSYGTGSTHYEQNQFYPDSDNDSLLSGAKGNNKPADKETYVIADYAQPIAKDVVINAGVKGSFSRINSYSDHYLLDPASDIYSFDYSQLNNFNYNRDIYAAYASVTFMLFKTYNLKLGLRDEDTKISLTGDTGVINPSYNFLIPSAVISRTLPGNQTLKLSYARRIQQARYNKLNPFIDATDPANLVTGNPQLRPERGQNVELSYYKFFEKGSSVLVTLYYRYSADDEQSYVLYYPTLNVGDSVYKNVAVTTNVNAGTQQVTGINISGTLTLSQKLEVRGGANLFDKYIQSSLVAGATSNSYNYRININATYQFNKNLIAEFFGNFNSARTEIQGKFPSFTSYSFAIRQMLLNRKASIAFTTTDPFNKYVDQLTDVTGQNFSMVSDRKIPYRSFGLNVTYKFGKIEYKEKKQEHTDTSEDQ